MRISTVVLFLCILFFHGMAQTNLGIKAGINTIDLEDAQIIDVTDNDSGNRLRITVDESNYGINIGLYLLARSKYFYIQPEVIYNSNSTTFQVDTLNAGNFINREFQEKYQYLDIPITMGFRLGPVRLGAGPVGHVFLNNTSDLLEFNGYEQDFESISLGYQAGFGLDFWSINVDLRYEGNLNEFGNHITVFGNDVSFEETPVRFIGTIGISF